MDIISLLNIKLEKELLDELKTELSNIPEERLISIIQKKIDKYPFFIKKKN